MAELRMRAQGQTSTIQWANAASGDMSTMSLDQMLNRYRAPPFNRSMPPPTPRSLPPAFNPHNPPPDVMEHLHAVEIWVSNRTGLPPYGKMTRDDIRRFEDRLENLITVQRMALAIAKTAQEKYCDFSRAG